MPTNTETKQAPSPLSSWCPPARLSAGERELIRIREQRAAERAAKRVSR